MKICQIPKFLQTLQISII